MKKAFTCFFVLAVMISMLGTTAFAAQVPVNYYDEYGNAITVNGLYYNNQGYPMFNAGCYYLDQDGNPVYVGGNRVYYYNSTRSLSAGSYYYDTNGRAVARPASYPGGWGRGAWYYDQQGNIVNSATYYDDFGNPVNPPSSAPVNPRWSDQPSAYRGYCGWCW